MNPFLKCERKAALAFETSFPVAKACKIYMKLTSNVMSINVSLSKSLPGLDFQHYASISIYSVSIKELVYPVVHAKQNGDFDFVFRCFALFYTEPQILQLRGNRLQNFITLQSMSWLINLTNMAIKAVNDLFDRFVHPDRTWK